MIRTLTLVFLLIIPCCAFSQGYVWKRSLPVPVNSIAFNPLSSGKIIFAGPAGFDGIYRSNDGGITWEDNLTNGLNPPINGVHQIFCVPNDTSIVLALTPNRLYRSTNGGYSWYIVNDTIGGVDGESICFHASNRSLYYGQGFAGYIWKSIDLGATWRVTGVGNRDSIGLCAMDISQDVPPLLIQGSEDTGLLARSTNEGASWLVTMRSDTSKDNKAEIPKVVFSCYAANPNTGQHSVAVATRWMSGYRSIVATSDGGITWQTLHSPNRNVWALDVDQRESQISKPSDDAYPLPLHMFTGLFDVQSDTMDLVQETTDGGASWHSIGFQRGIKDDTSRPILHYVWVIKCDTTSGTLAVATDSGVFIGIPNAASVRVGSDESFRTPIVMPNPAAFEVRVKGVGIKFPDFEVYDQLGRQVSIRDAHLTQSLPEGDALSLDVRNVPEGIYYLRLEHSAARFAIQR